MLILATSMSLDFAFILMNESTWRHQTWFISQESSLNGSATLRKCASVLSCVADMTLLNFDHFYRNHSWVSFQGFAESFNAALNIPFDEGNIW